jgi:hypothetical protein
MCGLTEIERQESNDSYFIVLDNGKIQKVHKITIIRKSFKLDKNDNIHNKESSQSQGSTE